VRQWFRYAYARDEVTDQDACSVASLERDFESSGGNIVELLFALTQTDAFAYRSVPEGETP
jgi:phytoene dehydrogenase-like protein